MIMFSQIGLFCPKNIKKKLFLNFDELFGHSFAFENGKLKVFFQKTSPEFFFSNQPVSKLALH